VVGVITTYNHPYTHDDHEAITKNLTVMGEVKDGRVVYAEAEDLAGPAHEKTHTKPHSKK
jgi:branched-chain amino acid transport system substrate-binding protein